MRRALLGFAVALAACGAQPSGDGGASAPEAAAQQPAAAPSDAERAAILRVMQMSANADGLVENECGEAVAPQFLPIDLGPGVGRAVLFVMTGGANTATCYGDGPSLHLLRETGGTWRHVYAHRGGPMIILPSAHNDANDIADGGPGFSLPVWEWNGTDYAAADRRVGDGELTGARFAP